MDKRERLAVLIVEANYKVKGDVVYRTAEERLYAIADYLLAHSVEIPPCRVGDTVYQTDGERVYEYVVRNVSYDTELITFDEADIGRLVFLTREEAETEKRRLISRKDCSS